jgi:15-cis-phytoene desaturase
LLGGKVAAWRDADGDVSETGLHVFFGAYPNCLNLFEDLGISDRLQWKPHQMWLAKPGKATREFSVFDFPPNLPAPFNAAVAILTSDMISVPEKLQLGVGLVPAYLFGQSYVESQEGVTVQQWMDARGIPKSVVDEVFDPMSVALGFIRATDLSMQCVLIALNRFLQESSGSRLAFLDGSPTERLCEPLKQYIEAPSAASGAQQGGRVRTNAPVERILVDPRDQSVAGLLLPGGEVVTADYYVSAMPVDALKKLVPDSWRDRHPYFAKLNALRGVPVMNIHIWLDRKLPTVDNLIFSRSPILSVYADMSVACNDYASNTNSMLELVLAPAARYMKLDDQEILGVVLGELERLFPQDIAVDGSLAQVTKFTIVRTPTSVYETTPGTEDARPTQASPIRNFFCAGDFSKQRYLASMEGAALSGKLAARAVAERHLENQQSQEASTTISRRRLLSERPPNPNHVPQVLPDRTMYVARLAPTPPDVQAELDDLASTASLPFFATRVAEVAVR